MANEIQDEINELLGELETSENDGEENETQKQGTENAVGAAESGQGGEQDQEAQQETETAENRGDEEQQEEADKVEQRKADQEQSKSDGEREETPEEENQRLRAELDRISGEVQKPAESQQSESSESETSEASDFEPLMGYEFDSLMEDQKQFSEWAKKLYEQAKSKAHEEILQSLPNTVNKYIEQQLSVRETANRFYEQNPELANYKQYVARLANDVAAEMSDKSWDEILQETGKRAYKNLNLQQQAQSANKENNVADEQVKNPGLAKGTKRQAGSKKGQSPKNADQRSETEKQIDQLLEFE